MNHFKLLPGMQFGFRVLFLICCGWWCLAPRLSAQSGPVEDTLNNRVQLMTQLVQATNFEQAQVEAEWLREFLKRHKRPIPPRALTLLSNIYKANADDRSATRMLAEAELDARRDPNPASKSALLSVLVREAARWELPDLALSAQQMLGIAQDSLRARTQRDELNRIHADLDSLNRLRAQEVLEQSRYVRLGKDRVLVLGLVILASFLAILFANIRSSDRWRKKLEKKDMEMDLLRTELRHAVSFPPVPESTETGSELQRTQLPEVYAGHHLEKPSLTALIIEPNRQIVMYLKSLLADRFQIETASTASEGQQMAYDELPDLIVCDALLNGTTGIELTRKIKLSERTNHIPVVLLSAHHGNEGKLDALRAGADAWFTRPVLDDEFDASIQRLLDGKKVRHELFARFLHLYFTGNRVSLDDPFLVTTVEMIEQNLSDPDFMAEHIAQKMQMKKQHFSKKLKALTGKEPVQLIREMRLEKAKSLLEKRAGTPQAIAELTGFSNPGTFALAFKEYFGENTLLLHLPPSGRS
jgi:DNA-binding response OmpR family regulator